MSAALPNMRSVDTKEFLPFRLDTVNNVSGGIGTQGPTSAFYCLPRRLRCSAI